MTNKGWRKIRVVVELPVQGDYSERDLKWDVERCLDDRLSVRHRAQVGKARLGRHTVKEYNRIERVRLTKESMQ